MKTNLRYINASLGVDIGTTGCRSVVYNDLAEIIGSSEKFYPTLSPQASWAEQNPEEVLDHVEASIAEAVAIAKAQGYNVNLVSFSAVNHGVMPVRAGIALRPCIIWADNRSTQLTDQWKSEGLAALFYKRTCCPLHPMYLPGKLAWLALHEPEVFQATEKFISFKELLFYRWFGQYVIDSSIASSSGLMNSEKMQWDEDILTLIGIQKEQLSEIVPTTQLFTGLKQELCAKLCLETDVQICIGAGDGVLSSLGTGALHPGELTVMIGTSGAARITVDRPTRDAFARTWCYYLAPKAWVVGGAINNAGLALQWVRQKWLHNMPFEQVEALVRRTAPGAEGLVFLPFLTGERSPSWEPNHRGVLYGLDLAHSSEHFARAAMEGVAYRIRSIFEPIAAMAGTVRSIRAGGGFVASSTWVHILANVLNQPLDLLGKAQGSAYGAVILGWFALGKLNRLDELADRVQVVHHIVPDPAQVDCYEALYQNYMELYERIYSHEKY